jgi:hypothetical protein
MQKITTQYLKNELFNLSKDDKKDLETTATALKDALTESDFTKVILSAINPNISSDDEIFQLIEKHLPEDWTTYYSNDKKKTISRVIVLEALSQIASKYIEDANLIWLSSRDIIQYYQLGKPEKDIIHSFLKDELGNIIESHASKNNQVNSINLTVEKFAEEIDVELDVEDLKGYLRAAIAAGQQYKEVGNRYWANNNAAWANDFAEIAPKAIQEFVQEAMEKQTETLNFFNKQLDKLLQDINEQIVSISKQNSFRSQIIWWNKSLYSISQKTTYRKIDYILLPIIIAYDLSQIVPFIYPESVDYLLRETIKEAKKEVNTINLKEWLGQIKTRQADLEKVIKSKATTYDRILLLNFIQEQCAVEDMEKRLGIEDAELTLEDLAVWLFHNFQVQNYLDNGTK